MSNGSAPRRSGPRKAAGVLGLFVVFIFIPLTVLALLDIAQGGEDLVLEWSIVWIEMLGIAAAQLATLALLWWPDLGRFDDPLTSLPRNN
jgi:hypothetical protein